MAVEMVKVRHLETGAVAELPATAVGRQEYASWAPVDETGRFADKPRRARGADTTQEG